MDKSARRQRAVTVFGAGVAGLTVAHELCVRGFLVEVIDAEYNPAWEDVAMPLDRGVGGMARSHWAIAANSAVDSRSRAGGGFEVDGKWVQRLWSGTQLLMDRAIALHTHDAEEGRATVAALAHAIQALEGAGLPAKTISILVPLDGYDLGDGDLAATLQQDPRVAALCAALASHGIAEDVVASMLVLWEQRDQLQADTLYFSPSGGIAAAEHGFRFFPSFYRHLFDTMRRTPILTPRDTERTRATVFENLVPTEGLGFARAGSAVSFMIPRRALTSFEAVRRLLRAVLEELEYSLADIARIQLKLFKYMTTSTARRCREYEHISWGQFLDERAFSAVSRAHIEYGPQMSAALRGSQSDARTQGNIAVQLLLDQLKPDAHADYTLAGPSSGVWLDHWHDFLLAQGVRFTRGRLVGFRAEDGEVRPVVEGAQPAGRYFVLALSLPAMAEVAPSFLEAAAVVGVPAEKQRDVGRVVAFAGDLERDLLQACPAGPLQHLSGIQFYFDQDVRFWRGHTQYLDSAWGLTSIAQAQFWARVRQADDDYRAILSVDIGIFDRPYRGKTAWECTADEIAARTWEQIRDHHNDAFVQRYGAGARFPRPIAYSLDEYLVFEERGGARKQNRSPFLVNRTGQYPTRPGEVVASRERSKNLSLYPVITSQPPGEATWGYVLAGTYLQTYTRLTSMESANESARHAVNALLQFWGVAGERCDIWDPEDHEIADLQWLKDLDEELLARGLPHFLDILRWEELPPELPPEQLAGLAQLLGARAPGRGAR
jgi:hypothetical protein